ncbi:MAG TPA: hypothetical protein VFZ41_08655 [Solirubrobacterales bacterium]
MTRTHTNPVSPATVLALIALFVSLGSVSYAAGMIGPGDIRNGAITKRKLRKNAVVKNKIRNGAVDTSKLRDDAVIGAKVNESTLGKVPNAQSADRAAQADSATTADSAVSAQSADSVGPNGVGPAALQTSSVGPSELQTNSVGPSELKTSSVSSSELGFASVRASDLGPIVIRSEYVSVPNNDTGLKAADCLSSERMLSGGASWGGSELESAAPNLRIAYSYPLGTDLWIARGYNSSGVTRKFIVYVLCLAS